MFLKFLNLSLVSVVKTTYRAHLCTESTNQTISCDLIKYVISARTKTYDTSKNRTSAPIHYHSLCETKHYAGCLVFNDFIYSQVISNVISFASSHRRYFSHFCVWKENADCIPRRGNWELVIIRS